MAPNRICLKHQNLKALITELNKLHMQKRRYPELKHHLRLWSIPNRHGWTHSIRSYYKNPQRASVRCRVRNPFVWGSIQVSRHRLTPVRPKMNVFRRYNRMHKITLSNRLRQVILRLKVKKKLPILRLILWPGVSWTGRRQKRRWRITLWPFLNRGTITTTCTHNLRYQRTRSTCFQIHQWQSWQ